MSTTSFDANAFLKTVTTAPGVYQMINVSGDIIYIGKARNLKNRLRSYFKTKSTNAKREALVSQINQIALIVTHSETEALLLECNLIKQHKPRFNILLRDDKSYPYIVLTQDAYPALSFYRGRKKKQGKFFGPYPSSSAVRETIQILIKLFKLRQCSNSYFRNRSRPCLQYQIGRCSAPCVNKISKQDYEEDVRLATLFLSGKSQVIVDTMMTRMQAAADARAYEDAAMYRDQIAHLRHIQEQQYVTTEATRVDVVAILNDQHVTCIQMLTIRQGMLLGNKAYFPKNPLDSSIDEILSSFLQQYYFNLPASACPKEIIIAMPIPEQDTLEKALSSKMNTSIKIKHQVRSERAKWLVLATDNAKLSLSSRINAHATYTQRLAALQQLLSLSTPPLHMECFDISHASGEATVASCVVFNEQGPSVSDYRRYNIRDINPGDDYSAMSQALLRRFSRQKKEGKPLPDLLVIDGGKGQVKQAIDVLKTCEIFDVQMVGIAKGPARKPGMEILYLGTMRQEIVPKADDPGLHLLQQIRDEAHRFAITGHRARRSKARKTSVLEEIEGIGAKKRRQLLAHFGGLQAIKNASIDELAKVKGFSVALAKRVFDALH